jgi:hypothetical protein
VDDFCGWYSWQLQVKKNTFLYGVRTITNRSCSLVKKPTK